MFNIYVMDNLVFFNKEGDSLNFTYDSKSDKYTSTLHFDANSSDLFKTIGLYLFENVDSIDFDSVDNDTNLQKFQLFNENRFTYNGSIYFTQSVTDIKAVNNNGTFYSKWIYGKNFESLYPIGTAIKFNNSVFEFSPSITYVVVGTKKGAIMVISNTDNVTYNSLYGGLTLSNVSISGLNSVGIYDYKRGSVDQLSSWNEPKFYDLLYNDKKLTIINGKTSSVVTIQDISIVDRDYYKFNISTLTYTQSSDLKVNLTLKTDLPTVYTGGLTLDSITNRIYFTGQVPLILKPNTNFIINDSVLNTNTLSVNDIPAFSGNVITTYYPLNSQVMWNNIIYQCIQGYTQSLTASTSPNDNSYWTSSITYLPSSVSLIDETLLNTSIHLTTNVLTYNQPFTYSNAVTMAYFAQRYASDFKTFNINLYYSDHKLNADLIYPSKYAVVDYLLGTYSITTTNNIVERVIQTKELLPSYVDTNKSSNKLYNVVINHIDDYGLRFLINGHVYHEETEYVYTGLNVDQVKTIDRTLRNFLARNFFRFNSIGIGVSLHSLNYVSDFDFYKDTVEFTTEYPNIPFSISIQMGSLAQYYVKHSMVSFVDMGSYLNIKINNIDYGIKVTSSSASVFVPDIPTALSAWVDNNYSILYGYGIYVSSVRNNLYFNIKEPNTRFKYSIRTNKLPIPGIEQYTITNYITGNLGSLIAGNQIIISATSSQDFEVSGFSTGMITSVNNTIYPFDNQEYNIIHVDPKVLGLSYQGPFWGTNGSECTVSGMGAFGFSSLSYAISACPTASSGGGQFGLYDFSSAFSIQFIMSNTYQTTTTVLSNSNMVDILYVDEYSMLYTLGDNLNVVDALTLDTVATIELTGSTVSNKIVYNGYNKLLYVLTNNYIFVVDPNLNEIIASISISPSVTDIVVNQPNGEVYTVQSGFVRIYKPTSFVTYDYSISITSAKKIVHNFVDNYMYVTGDKVYVINTVSRAVMTSYVIPSLDNNYVYTEPTYGSVYVWGTNLYKITAGVTNSIPINNIGFNKIIYDNFNGDMYLSQALGNSLTRFNSGNAVQYSVNISYGDIIINQFDGDIYMVNSAGVVLVIQPSNGVMKFSINSGYPSTKIIYNPLRNSCISLATVGILYEVAVVINSVITQSNTASSPQSTSDGFYGTLANDYVQKDNIWLKTRQYLRRPRFNYSDNKKMQFVWSFEDDQVPDIFMYDVSGDYLTTGTSYSYTGPKPLPHPVLNYSANMDITKIDDSSVQQTVFDEIVNTLEYYDDSNDISILPTPMQLFLGYNSENEGYQKTTLKMYSRENISFYIEQGSKPLVARDYGTYGIVSLDVNSPYSFVIDGDNNKRGLRIGQLLQIYVSDTTNTKNKYISFNNGKIFKINQVYNNQIILDYIPDVYGVTASLVNEESIVNNFPTPGNTTVLKYTFTVVDKEMVNITIYGQTEIEDIRYKTELNNIGRNIDPSDAYIFKTYDVTEQGIDWKFLNKKRKEMLIVKNDIFSYVGSYKAIINAINYFGYNDLVLYEYYRNININSPEFFKLFKVEIPDIFDNTVQGWTLNDFLKHTMPNPNYEVTNLFNLTYLITDKKGNNVLLYSLQEVLIKLHGLKNWLEKNVIPITHRILDITGRTDFVGVSGIRHKSFSLNGFKVNEYMTPIDFNINEAYLMPINSGSTVYNVVIDFVASKNGKLPSNFTLNIRTYKTFKEWNPFTTYNIGDEVIYYGIIYKSIIDSNKILDPRKYDSLPAWSPNVDYFNGQMVNYNRYAYEYLGTQSSFLQFGTVSVPTPAQTSKWLNISEWVQVDLKPVQNITEYRYIGSVTYSNNSSRYLYYTSSNVMDNITPSPSFNFSIDSNIDPFIVIEVNSENGYGLSYTSKKNYEIRGLNDLFAGVKSIEPIGPFTPISPVITPLP